jgi:hypothetical protein
MNNLIAPEIVNDTFAQTLEAVVRFYKIKSILELGASSGEGSTACFVRGMADNPDAKLYSLEASKERFAALQQQYANNPRVICINAFSVPKEEWLTHNQIDLYVPQYGNEFGSATYKLWLQMEIDYQAASNVPTNGIAQALALNGGPFDFVLIDSSLFSGDAEFKAVYGAKFLALDDTRSMKTGPSFKKLLADPAYKLFGAGPHRYGWAVFQHV